MAAADIPADIYNHPFVLEVSKHFPGAIVTAVRPKESDMVDMSPSKFEPFSRAFQAHIDAALETAQQEQEPRTYLGGSRLGHDCARALAYEYTHTPVDTGRHSPGSLLRVFDMGHDIETRTANYLRKAGFTMLTERADGRQFGFYIAKHPETGEPRIAGHLDGVITAGPDVLGDVKPGMATGTFSPLAYPMLWENKGLNAKGWAKTLKQGVKRAKPIYYTQMQVYMHHLDLSANPGLFTATNRDTGELYAELVPFDPAAVQEAIDKGVKVITAQSPEELPRAGGNREKPPCMWCSYQDRCWSAPASGGAATPAPNWMAPPA